MLRASPCHTGTRHGACPGLGLGGDRLVDDRFQRRAVHRLEPHLGGDLDGIPGPALDQGESGPRSETGCAVRVWAGVVEIPGSQSPPRRDASDDDSVAQGFAEPNVLGPDRVVVVYRGRDAGIRRGMEHPGDVEEAAEGRAAVEPDMRGHNATQADAPDDGHTSGGGGGVHMSYVRFGAMIATSTVVMFGLMYLHTYTWDHVRWSETRAYMALVMGATMAVIMLGFMLSMYRSTVANIAIAVGAVLLFAGSLWLVRSQVTVQDQSYMRAMIPHHSIAILTSERSELADYRVCELAVEIIEAQRREIAEMDWLIADIAENGPADTSTEAEERAVPDFIGTSKRSCA